MWAGTLACCRDGEGAGSPGCWRQWGGTGTFESGEKAWTPGVEKGLRPPRFEV